MIDELKWDAAGLLTVVAQDRRSGEVRMVAHANREALTKTLDTGRATFWSRSRQALWTKGESSGNTLAVFEVWADCDGDAVVYLVEPAGPTCHTGAPSCFFRRLDRDPSEDGQRALPVLAQLGATIEARRESSADASYTKSLLTKGPEKIAAKIREEGGELGDALVDESDERVVSESADVLYHLLVGLAARGLAMEDVAVELGRRFGMSGLEEKASRD
jgi:phosphoribosyl-ATP pyrophosphohydrolase/phosphoribosyl-AMP cyclohydrolase